MIKAVSNFKKNDSNGNLCKISSFNANDLVKQYQPAQVSFAGLNYSRTGKNLLGEIFSHLSGKVRRFAEEVFDSSRILTRKVLKSQDELHFAEKPITCDIYTNDKMKAELDRRAQESVIVNSHKKDTERLIKDAGHSVSSSDIDSSGYPTSSGKEKINNPTWSHKKHHEDFSNEPSFKGQDDVTENLTANDGINDIDSGHLVNRDNLEGSSSKLSMDDYLAKLDSNDLDGHSLDLNHSELDHNLDGHELDIDGHALEQDLDVDGRDLGHDLDNGADGVVADIDPNLDIDPPDLG